MQTQLRLISRMDIDNPTFDVVMGILQQNWALLDDEISEVAYLRRLSFFGIETETFCDICALVGLKTSF